MFHRYIESVELRAIAPESERTSRRGIIATFRLIAVPNMPYCQSQAIEQVQSLFGPLGCVFWHVKDQAGKPGEQFNCWIGVGTDGKSVFVDHKYWSEEQINAFRQIVDVIAPIHRWTVRKSY